MSKVTIFDLDFPTMYADFVAQVGSIPELADWDITNPNDPVNLLMQYYLHQIERYGVYANDIANEFALGTAAMREMVLAHAKKNGYVWVNLTSSSVLIDASFKTGASPYTIPVGTFRIFSKGTDGSKVYFENAEQIVIPSGGGEATSITNIKFKQGLSRSITFVSDGTPYQVFYINDYVSYESSDPIRVYVGAGTPTLYTEVYNLENTGSTDEVYARRAIDNGLVQITFGNGVNGYVPSKNEPITITYRSSSGRLGNVKAGTIIYFDNTASTVPSEKVISVTNPVAASGGQDFESVESIRRNTPLLSRLNDRICSVKDITTWSKAFTGIVRAQAFSDGGQNSVVYIVPQGGGMPSTTLIEDLEASINSRIVVGHHCSVLTPTYVPANMKVTIRVLPNYQPSTVAAEVKTALLDLLNPFIVKSDPSRDFDFGESLTYSTLYPVIRECVGVKDVVNLELAYASQASYQYTFAGGTKSIVFKARETYGLGEMGNSIKVELNAITGGFEFKVYRTENGSDVLKETIGVVGTPLTTSNIDTMINANSDWVTVSSYTGTGSITAMTKASLSGGLAGAGTEEIAVFVNPKEILTHVGSNIEVIAHNPSIKDARDNSSKLLFTNPAFNV